MSSVHDVTFMNVKDEDEYTTYEFTWTVKYKELLQKKFSRNLKLFSETSKDLTGQLQQLRLQLKMQFLGHNSDMIEIYYLTPRPMFLSYTVNYSRQNTLIIGKKDFHNIPPNQWQYIATLTKENMLSQINQRTNTVYDLSIQFKFIENNMKSIKEKVDNIAATSQYLAQFSKNFEDMLQNGLYSDFTMKSADGYEYKVHRAILASRSAVLKAHFDHNTIECSTNTIESPFEGDVLQTVLAFIYTNKALNIDEMSEKLIVAADYYQIDDLMSLCEESIMKRLTVENAMELLQLADNHGAKNLKQSIMQFIRYGPSTITNTEGWANIESVKLIKEVCKFIMGANAPDKI